MARWLAIILLVSQASFAIADGPYRQEFVLKGGATPLMDVPVAIPLPDGLSDDQPLRLIELSSGREISMQRRDAQSAFFILDERLPAEAQRRYRLETRESSPADADQVTCREVDGVIRVQVRGRNVFDYHTTVVEPPAGVDAKYRRSGHIHPVWTPASQIVTDEFPVDHYHQHAVFAAWVKTEFQGRKVDFWNQHEGTGTVEHRQVIHLHSGPVFGRFQATLAHVDLSAPNGPVDALLETWTVTTYALASGHLFEVESEQRCATKDPVLLKQYHYGGMAIRGADEWRQNPQFEFVTSLGNGRKNGNHTRPDWVSLLGPVDGKECAITLFSLPTNERSPQPIRLHPDFPYCVYSPVVLGDRAITPERPYVSKYLFYASDGPVDANRIKQIWTSRAASLKSISR